MLGTLQSRFRAGGRIDPVSNIVGKLIVPPRVVLGSIGGGIGSLGAGIARGPALIKENERLKSENLALRMYQETYDDLEKQLKEASAALMMPDYEDKIKVPARILKYEPVENLITINIGSSHGVKANQPVITSAGLCGTVTSVSSDTTSVTLITSPTISVGAIILNDTPTAGLTKGVRADTLSIEVVGSAKIKQGDLVVTSGFSKWIPAMVPLGEVVEVTDLPDYGTRVVTVFPSFKIGVNQEVFVLK